MTDRASNTAKDVEDPRSLSGASPHGGELEIDEYMAQLQAAAWSTPPSSPGSDKTLPASVIGNPNRLDPTNQSGVLCEYCQTLRLSLRGYEDARQSSASLYLGRLVMPEAVEDTPCPLCMFIRRHKGFRGISEHQSEIATSLGAPVPAPQDQASWESEWRIQSRKSREGRPSLSPDSPHLEIRELCLTPRQLHSRLFVGRGSTTLSWVSYTGKALDEGNSETNRRIHLNPKVGHYSFVIASEPASPSIRCFGGRLVEPPLSQQGLLQIKEWLEDCDSNHSCCRSSTHDTQMPTRVIDLGDAGEHHKPRLLVTNGRRGRYLALSHRWSSRPFARLSKGNLEQFRDSLPTDGLPQSFMDAIQVTQALGIRYLWIDALCIIQDDKEDWKREAELMCSVFGNSYCTLAATCSKEGGSFLKRKTVPEKIPIPCGDDSSVYLVSNFPTANPKEEIGAAELNSRGWAMQERLLSRRVIHFGESQLYWECRTLTQGQNGEFFTAGGIVDFLFPLLTITKTLGSGADVPTDTAFQLLWVKIAEHYSACSLTDEDDRVDALLGLVDLVGRRTARKFVSGHWFGHGLPISACLLWTVTDSIPTAPSPRVSPSWSWIGLAGKVSFHTTERSAQASPEVLFVEENEEDTRFPKLLIQGKILEAEAPQSDSPSRVVSVFKKGQQLHARSSPIGNVTFDFVDDRPSDIACLHLYTDLVGYTIVLFLALCCEGEMDNVYRRVGIGSLSRHQGPALFSNEAERILILQ